MRAFRASSCRKYFCRRATIGRSPARYDALARCSKILCNALDEAKPTGAVFIDLTRAFERLDHFLLLKKLLKLDFRGNIDNLLGSYVTNRTQKVRMDTCYSSPKGINVVYSLLQGVHNLKWDIHVQQTTRKLRYFYTMIPHPIPTNSHMVLWIGAEHMKMLSHQ